MKFGEYLKNCRQRYSITQEEFVNHLYNFDDLFSKLDPVTLSRWERGITSPNLERQKKIIEALGHYSPNTFPSSDFIDFQDLKNKSTSLCISKISGKHKRYVLDFPKDLIETNKVNISNMKQSDTFDIALKLTYNLHKKITNDYSQLTLEHFEQWASHQKSFFLLSSYEGNFFGMFFSLQLKKEIFDKLLSKEMEESDITLNDFAKEGERSHDYLLGFFAYSEESATLLIIEYYQYLMKHQTDIQQIGSLIKIEPGHALVKSLGLHTGTNDNAYKGSIHDVLLSPTALTIFFEKFVSNK